MNKYAALLRFLGVAIFLVACGGGSSTATGTGSDGGDGGGGGHIDSGHVDGGAKDGGGKDGGAKDSGAKDTGGQVGDGGHDGGGQVGDGGHEGGEVGDSGHDSGPATFTIGGTVVGLTGTGLVLQDNSGDNLTVTASGGFTFTAPVAAGGAFSVTVLTQPSTPTQTCTVTGGTGTVGSADVTSVMVNCGTDYVIGGTISGLAGASVVLQDNGGDNLTVTANGTFAFATPVETGGAYAVTVLTQPSMPTQTCTISTGTGTGTVGSANVTSVSVVCTTNTYTIGGTVSGLAGTGLVLQDNGGDNLTVSANGTVTFATPVASGAPYAVTVLTQPTVPTQSCIVSMGAGTVAGANVTNVSIACTTATFAVGGKIAGLAANDSVTLQDNGGDNLKLSANGTFTFATPVASGATIDVTVLSEPGAPAQTCVVSGGTGTIVAAPVTSVMVNCTTNTYTIGGTISGLAGTVVLQDNAAGNTSLTMNGAFSFTTAIASGANYAVTVLTQPGTPAQTCVVTNGAGTVASANVTSVTVACTTNTYTVGGTLSGLAATESVVLQNNAANSLTVGANGSFTFTTPIASAGAYAVTVLTNPASPSQNCVVTLGAGTVTNASITSVVVTCTTDTCPAETTSACVLTTTNSGSTDTGTCAAGSTGACSYSCNLGTWTKVTDTCVAQCVAGTMKSCVLTTTNSGNTDTGTCAAGSTGSCSFSCNAGAWSQVTDTCTATLSTLNFDGYDGYLLSGTTCGTTCGNAPDLAQANDVCVLAGYTASTTYAVQPITAPTCWCLHTDLSLWNPCCSGSASRDMITSVSCQ